MHFVRGFIFIFIRTDYAFSVRRHFVFFLDEKNLDIGPMLDKPKFKFSIPNKWYENPLDEHCLEVFASISCFLGCILFYRSHNAADEIWCAEIKAAVLEAWICSLTWVPGATVPVASFYAQV